MSIRRSTVTLGSVRLLAAQTPALIIATLALVMSAGGAAYASNQLSHGSRVTNVVTLHKLTLLHGWKSQNGYFTTGDPSVGIANGIVYLSGSMAQPTPGDYHFATLPLVYRPAHNLYITVYTNNVTTGALFIYKNGFMDVSSQGSCGAGNNAQCYTSLAAVSFPKNS